MQETLYKTVNAEVSLSDNGCRRHSIRQRMRETPYQTVDTEVSLSDSGGRSLSIRQRMQESLFQTADAEVYHLADAEDTLSDSGCI